MDVELMIDLNLDALSVAELQALRSDVDNAIERKKVSELLAVRGQLDALIAESPFTLDEIMETKPAKKPLEPKYRNPDDLSQTWSGRGRKPAWLVAYLDGGGTLEEVEI